MAPPAQRVARRSSPGRAWPNARERTHAAIALGVRGFKDAVQAEAALAVGADYIITGNKKDFTHAPVAAPTAGEVLPLNCPRAPP